MPNLYKTTDSWQNFDERISVEKPLQKSKHQTTWIHHVNIDKFHVNRVKRPRIYVLSKFQPRCNSVLRVSTLFILRQSARVACFLASGRHFCIILRSHSRKSDKYHFSPLQFYCRFLAACARAKFLFAVSTMLYLLILLVKRIN